MRRGRRSAADRACGRLLECWQRRPEYGEPIGCVATTFTFDPAHFEEHCLARFLGLESDPAEDTRGYLVEREEKLSQAFACVLVDQAHVSAERSLRWNLLPIRIEGGGIMHAKISLLAWEECIRVLVSSANLTEPGYRRNFENMAVLDFKPDGELPLSLLHEVIGFLDDVRRAGPGHGAAEGPQPALDRFLRGIEARVRPWHSTGWRRGSPSASLVFTGPGRPSLFQQLGTLWTQAPAHEAWVLSPFYDDGDGALGTVAALETLLVRRGDRSVHFIAPGQRLASGIIELELPACVAKAAKGSANRRFHRVKPLPDDAGRALHAKSIWLERGSHALFCLGSSNFTAAGTGARAHGPVNVEANVTYVLPSVDEDFAAVCALAYPPIENVNPDEEDVRFLATADRTPELDGHAPLPACFGGALYRAREPDGALDLEILRTPPADSAVLDHEGNVVLPASGWPQSMPSRVEVIWRHHRPPSHLIVTWPDVGVERRAIWPVNVADPSALPPPDELRQLTLDELVEVLVSARPMHEVIGRILRRRSERSSTSTPEVDPHKKVDTRNFLLKRMRRFSDALEELRARLERPVHTRAALAWRLRGPLGPVALATRLVADDPDCAGFLIAETALTLRSLQMQLQGDVSREHAESAVADVVAELGTLASAHPAAANLAAYVASAFREGGP